MKNSFILLLSLLSLATLTSGCATINLMEMRPEPSPSQKAIYVDGRKTIVSQKKYLVSLSPYRELNPATDKTSYILFIQNLGQDEITVGSDNVSISFSSTSDPSSSGIVRVQPYSEVMQEIDNQEMKARNAAAIGAFFGALSAQSSAHSTSTTNQYGTVNGNYSGNTYGTYSNNPLNMHSTGSYNGSYTGTSTTTTYDPAKAQALANQNNDNFRYNINNITRNANSARQMMDSIIMKTQTIMPGQSNVGLVVTDTRSMNSSMEGYFQVMVDIDNERHIFTVYRTFHDPDKQR